MQSTAISFCPSVSFSTKLQKPGPSSLYRFSPIPPKRLICKNGSVSGRVLNPISCCLRQTGWVSGLPEEPEFEGFVVRATSVPGSAGAGESPKSKGIGDTLVLGTLFGLWYLFNIYFNIYNKQNLRGSLGFW